MFYKNINLNNILCDVSNGNRWSASSRAYELFSDSLCSGTTISALPWIDLIYQEDHPSEVYLVQSVDWNDSDWIEVKRIVKDSIEVKQKSSIREALLSVKEDTESRDKQQSALINALMKSNGQVAMACRAANLPMSQYKYWMKSDAIFRDRVIEVRERVLDEVSFALINNAKDGDIHSIKYFMDANAKDRGYGDSKTGGNKINSENESLDLNKLSIEEQEQLLRLIDKAKPDQLEMK
jgi:hypothetical protein